MIKSLLAKYIKITRFYSSPFTWIFCFYSLGILFESELNKGSYNFHTNYLAILLILFLIFQKFRAANPIPFIIIMLGCFLLGQANIILQKNEVNGKYILTSEGESRFLISLEEYELKDSITAKAVGRLYYLENEKWKDTGIKSLLYLEGKKVTSLSQNDFILTITKFHPIANKNNPGEFNAINFWKTKGITHIGYLKEVDILEIKRFQDNWIDKQLAKLRNKLSQVLKNELNGSNLAIAQALILGDKSLLDQETRNSFGATGAMHVLAVSGLHIGIITQLLLYLFQFSSKLITRRNAVFITVLLLWIYALLTGFSPSVVRAVFMFSVLILAQETGGNYAPINVLFFTAFILLLFNPYVIYDIGFQLSYLAMLGIYTLYKPIAAWYITKNKILNYLWQGSAIGFAAQAMTVPLTLYYFHQFPNYFALTNLGIMGISTVAMGFGMGIFILHYIPFIGKIASFILATSLWLMLRFLQWVEHLPGSVEYGFNVPLYLVPFLMLAIFLIIVTDRTSTKWKLSSGLFIGLLCVISYNRYEQHNESHICFFNNNQFAMAIKIKSQIVVIYDWKNAKKTDQLTNLISNYTKYYPGNVTFLPLKKENITLQIGHNKLTVNKEKYGKLIVVNNKEHRLINTEDYLVNNTTTKSTLFMPWINHKQSLAKGAKIYKM
jgi:competence protein ComEC